MPDNKPKLLIVEDDEGLQAQLKWAYDDFDVVIAGNPDAALAALRADEPVVVTLDLGLPPDPDGVSEGFAVLNAIMAMKPDTKVVVASGHGARESALQAIELGAYDFYQKPVDIEALGLIVGRAYKLHQIEAENRRLAEKVGEDKTVLGSMITAAPEMAKVARTIERVAPTNVSVMLLGASGTGKELLARGLHDASGRRNGAFIAINCAAIPENLLESELFGHEKGAFTGAIKTTEGKIELASGGTLFLDEVGDIPQALQVKLLRLLETGTYRRVGGVEPQHADFRLICASHKSLKKLVETGAFRQDLYYRIAVFPIALPRLAERSDDIPLLVQTFLRRIKGGERKKLSKEAQSCLSRYAFPGNIRELRNILERAVLLTDDDVIDLQHLPDECRNTSVLPAMLKEDEAGNGVITPLKDLEKTYLLQLSQAFQGDKKSLAAALGVSERTLYRKLQSL